MAPDTHSLNMFFGLSPPRWSPKFRFPLGSFLPKLVEPRPLPLLGWDCAQSDQSVQSMLLFSEKVQEIGLWRLNY